MGVPHVSTGKKGYYGPAFALVFASTPVARVCKRSTAIIPPTEQTRPARPLWLIGTVAFGALLGWAYWPALAEMAEKWFANPQYCHGVLVPAFAAYLLWHRRRLFPAPLPAPSTWGLLAVAVGAALYFAAAYTFFDTL